MNLVRRVFINTFWLGVGEFVTRLVSFVIIIWLARKYGPNIYGQWSFALGFVTIFSVLADFGFSQFTIREIACHKEKTSEYFSNIIFLKIILGSLTWMAMIVTIFYLREDVVVRDLVFFLGIYTIINTFAAFLQSIFRANEQMYYEMICRLVQSVSLMMFATLLMVKSQTIISVSYAYMAAAVLGLLCSIFFVKRFLVKFFFRTDLTQCKEILKNSWPFAISAIGIIIYYHIDIIIIGLFYPNSAVGYYTAAYNVILLVIAGINLLVMSIFPTISRVYKKFPDLFNKTIEIFFKIILFFSFPITVVIFYNAKFIIKTIYGQEFTEFSTGILQILIWSVLILYNYAMFAIGLSSTDHQKIYLRGVVYGAIFNTLSNLLLVPKYGYWGAASTTVITELLVCVYMTRAFIKVSNFKLPYIFIGKIILSAGFMFLAIFWFQSMHVNIIIASAMSLIVYFVVVIYFLRTFENSLILQVKEVLLNK